LSLNFCILASGSSGNCAIIWTDKTAALVDLGCSYRYLLENLDILKIPPKNLEAIFLTHAHMDHISASGLNFIIKNNVPIFTHDNVLKDIYKKYGDKIKKCLNMPFSKRFEFKDLVIESFDVHHKDRNVSRTLGFTFSHYLNRKEYKIGYVTDTGKICSKIINNLINSNILVIESNYNRMMLDVSFRPYDNKMWVLSDFGHLSNEDAAIAVCKIKKLSTKEDSLKYVYLAHISHHHNTKELAIKTVKKILSENNIKNINLLSTKRKQKSQTIRIK
jgi:phosphoribosyl 1,2-cyclic phosphodiesterase